jgi:hypothetical protein
MEENMQVVRIFDDPTQAELAKGQLEKNGIEAYISRDDAGGMLPNLQQTEGIRLLVKESDERQARVLLDKLKL